MAMSADGKNMVSLLRNLKKKGIFIKRRGRGRSHTETEKFLQAGSKKKKLPD